MRVNQKISRGLNKPIRVGSIDERYIGHEPTWDDQADMTDKDIEARVVQSYTWYNYMLTDKDKVAVVASYLAANGYSKAHIQAFSTIEHYKIPSYIVALARMMQRGFLPDKDRQARFDAVITELLAVGRERIASKKKIEKKKATVKVLSIQDHIRNAVNDHIAEIEEQFDEFLLAGFKSEFKCYDYLAGKQVKPALAKKIAEYYEPQRDEFKQVLMKSDDDLVEGYKSRSKKQVIAMRDFFDGIIADCETWSSNSKASRRPRKKREKSVEKQTQRVKFQKEDKDLKVVSIDPTKMIGALEVWLFSTKYRLMHRYVAKDRAGLQIKGTTLQNFDEKQSQSKKVRKPEEFIRSIVDGGPKAIVKTFEKLNSKAYSPNGRINEKTLIVRVVK